MFVIYHKETTKLLRVKSRKERFETEAAAKAALTRRANAQASFHRGLPAINKEDYAIAEAAEFFKSIEKKEIRKGIIHSAGAEFEVGVNTPWTSGPWSETYFNS